MFLLLYISPLLILYFNGESTIPFDVSRYTIMYYSLNICSLIYNLSLTSDKCIWNINSCLFRIQTYMLTLYTLFLVMLLGGSLCARSDSSEKFRRRLLRRLRRKTSHGRDFMISDTMRSVNLSECLRWVSCFIMLWCPKLGTVVI